MKRDRDYYSRLARQKGYPARSVFKLAEMQKRFRLLEPGQRILDLGSAPGSWSRFCLQRLGRQGFLAGVDLQEPRFRVPAGPQYRFIPGDLFDPQVETRIKELGPFDLVLSDAAPQTSGSSLVDVHGSLRIARRALEIAAAVLPPGGKLAVKIFQGGEEGEVLREMKSLFQRARAFKPAASRSESREIYLLGLSYRSKR